MQAQIVHGRIGGDAEQSPAMPGRRKKKKTEEKPVPWRELAEVVAENFDSISAAARECEVEDRTFHYYVSGRSEPDHPTLRRICEKLKVSPNRLFGYSAPPDELPADERGLLINYRAISAEHRQLILERAKTLAEIDNPPFPHHVRRRT